MDQVIKFGGWLVAQDQVRQNQGTTLELDQSGPSCALRWRPCWRSVWRKTFDSYLELKPSWQSYRGKAMGPRPIDSHAGGCNPGRQTIAQVRPQVTPPRFGVGVKYQLDRHARAFFRGHDSGRAHFSQAGGQQSRFDESYHRAVRRRLERPCHDVWHRRLTVRADGLFIETGARPRGDLQE